MNRLFFESWLVLIQFQAAVHMLNIWHSSNRHDAIERRMIKAKRICCSKNAFDQITRHVCTDPGLASVTRARGPCSPTTTGTPHSYRHLIMSTVSNADACIFIKRTNVNSQLLFTSITSSNYINAFEDERVLAT